MDLKTEAVNLTKSVIELFKDKFVRGEIRPGDILPSERELVDQLGVSRTTIRESLIALKVIGLVDMKQGKRAVVTSPSIENILEIFSLVAPLKQETILDLLELREVFEPACVVIATIRATTSELSVTKRNLEGMIRSLDNLDAFFKWDYAFHQSIMYATHNEMIVNFYNVFKPLLKSMAKEVAVSCRETESHEKLLLAMIEGESEMAGELARQIIVNARHLYFDISLEKAQADVSKPAGEIKTL